MGKYKDGFAHRRVTGQILPSLALDEGKYLETNMGVSPEDRITLTRHILREVFRYAGIPTPSVSFLLLFSLSADLLF